MSGQVTLKRYWELRFGQVNRPESDYVERLSAAIRNSVERRTRDRNCRYGILLSGGLDSRAVLSAMDRDVTAFTVCESPNREVRTAASIAREKGCKHIFVRRARDHYFRTLEKAVELSDGLCALHHAHFIDILEQIDDNFDVLFHGCYLDHFKGFTFPLRQLRILGRRIEFKMWKLLTSFWIDQYLSGLTDSRLSQAFLEDERFVNQMLIQSSSNIFTSDYSRRIALHLPNAVRKLVKEARARGATPSDVWDYIVNWQALSKQRTFLHLGHIRAFVPERTAALDNELIDLYFEMPDAYKRNGRVYRKALRKLNSRIAALPDSNTRLTPNAPKWLVSIVRNTIALRRLLVPREAPFTEGSWPDFSEMLRQSDWRNILEHTIKDPECLDPEIFEIDRIMEMYRAYLNGKNEQADLLWLLLTFGRWHKKFGPYSRDYAHSTETA
jgi:asparagine synthase (glutamine-hydrolysing)